MSDLLPGVGFGAVKLGASRTDVEAALGPSIEHNEIFNHPAHGVQVFYKKDKVDELTLFDAAYFAKAYGAPPIAAEQFASFAAKTADGIGIGSSEADVKRTFGAPPKTERVNNGTWLYYAPIGISIKVADGTVREIGVHKAKPPKKK